MTIKEICQRIGCEKFHVYYAIKLGIISFKKDTVGRYSIDQKNLSKLKDWYIKLPKRKRKEKSKRTRKGYIHEKKTKVPGERHNH